MFDDTKPEKGKDDHTKKTTPNQKINSAFDSTRQKLMKVAGISNVKTIEDTANFKFGLAFSFSDIASLNKAMNKLFEEDTVKPGTKEIIYFERKGDQLIRNELLDSKSLLGKSGSLSTSMGKKLDNSFFGMDELFATVSYTTNYEFENKIERSGNENSLLSSNMKKVTIKCYPFAVPKDSTQKKCSVANTITFK
ncbi:MAG: hypothetical protein JWN78_24 [Bacteroidota bacterium]|nr:hypothetical protein [Bacteroidota bacterium]